MRTIFKKFSHLLGKVYQWKYRKMMLGDFEDMIAHNTALNTNYTDGEKDFLHKWGVITKKVSPLAYRMYSPFIGKDTNILPPDVGRAFVEPILNSSENVPFYNDKNSLNLFVSEKHTPKVYFRSIGHKLMDGSYNPVQRESFDDMFTGVNKLIVKPAKDQGGSGISFFERKNGVLKNDNNEELSIELLEKNYKTDYLVQECFVQSEYMSQFNPTSVNTIRAITYRDVKTGEIHFRGAVLRIGRKGATIDNATAGGSFIGIDEKGRLKNKVFDKYGRYTTIFNDIDFENTSFIIPNYEGVKEFAKYISLRVPHMSLFALDIVLDKENHPKLIEVNTQSFTDYFMQLPHEPVFGEFTDDVISYCIDNKNNIRVRFRYM